MESSLVVSLHVQSVDQVKAIKTIKRKITDLQKMTIEEQKKAVRAGYDMDIIPSDLATYGTEAKKLLQDLLGAMKSLTESPEGASQSHSKRNGSPSGWKMPCSTSKRSCPSMTCATQPMVLK